MEFRRNRQLVVVVAAVMLAAPMLTTPMLAAPQGRVQGTFVVDGVEAGLGHARAKRMALDDRTPGYAVLLSARLEEGDIAPWRSGDPKERGSFIFLLLEKTGAVWVAEIAHADAKNTHFGVVTEVQVKGFSLAGDRMIARITTNGEQTFTDDRYSIDLEIDVPIEK